MRLQQRYRSQLLERTGCMFSFEFVQIDGKNDKDLFQTVFDEFIYYPILRCLERGKPVIRPGKTALRENLITVIIKKERDRIGFVLSSPIFENEIVPNEQVDVDGENKYIAVNEDEKMLIHNISASEIGTTLAAWYVIEWLDGMVIDVDLNDYVVSCDNCVYNSENAEAYKYLCEIENRRYVENTKGCLRRQKDMFEKGDGCGRFYRDTYPDLGEIRKVLDKNR